MKKLILLFFGISIILPCKSQTIKNLVFEGGGIRGLAYAGALMEMQERNMLDSVERLAGTSAGAIAATLYAVGYSPEEISNLIAELKIKSFADGEWIFIGGTSRIIKNFGWYKGDKFHHWISDLIKYKTGKETLTFSELHTLARGNKKFKELYLTGTNLTLQRVEIFSHETYPEMEIRAAVRISMSIPFYFQAVMIDEEGKVLDPQKNTRGYVMVDGGVIANFPIHIFDHRKYMYQNNDSAAFKNPQTVGLRLDTDEQIFYDEQEKGLAPVEIQQLKNFTAAFYNIVIENLNRKNLTSEDWSRTISISTGDVGPRIRKISEEDKNILIENGKKGVRKYLSTLY
ncbi:MAG: patatin-like phospholipase family protein [Cytophagaceae bacterium]|nr:patatin-like phospholipase family protein [Cytophagaceae bacterium]